MKTSRIEVVANATSDVLYFEVECIGARATTSRVRVRSLGP
jgi:hypothetical protein